MMEEEYYVEGGEVCVVEDDEEEEIDFDYEYDAPRCFDFMRDESASDVDAAERWFWTATSYPPSPFIVRLKLTVDVEASCTKSKDQNTTCSSDNDGVASEVSTQDENNEGLASNLCGEGKVKPKLKSPVKLFIPRSSTLLKPTASHLAKLSYVSGGPSTRSVGRLQQLRSPQKLCGETEGSKRQKLEIGYLRRVAQLKHQALFSHKSPKKEQARLTNISGSSVKPKVTIPKEPDLVTARRAQRHRSRNVAQQETDARPVARTFKARPLNRKILEGPSVSQPKKSTPQLPDIQVFHSRNSERAAQQVSDNMSSTASTNSSKQSRILNHGRTNSNESKQGKTDPVYRFKAHPLNKKIFSSKGDIGVFCNNKQEATISKEFNFSNRKTLNPPIELFSKLSISCKGSKENVPTSCSQDNRMANTVVEKSSRCGMKQGQHGGVRAHVEMKSHTSNSRYDLHTGWMRH